MNIAKESRVLADYILSLNDFNIYHPNIESNDTVHIGALLTDSILQAGLNYTTVVKPRVEFILSNYPTIYTLKDFQLLIDCEGIENIINWYHPVKINRLLNLVEFLSKRNLDSGECIRIFMSDPSNRKEMQSINGIGPKTIDYMLKLLNFDVVAVDRHIYKFLDMAKIPSDNYVRAKNTVEFAADFLNVSRASIDYSIWNYISQKKYININGAKEDKQLLMEFNH